MRAVSLAAAALAVALVGCSDDDTSLTPDLGTAKKDGKVTKIDGPGTKIDKGSSPKLDRGANPKLDKGANPKLDKGTPPPDKGQPPPDKGPPPKLDQGPPPTGTGFAASPTTWSVPNNPFHADGFDHTAYATTTQYWGLMDMDGDKRVDLVWTSDPSTGKVWGAAAGTPHWKVFKGGAGGFAMTTTVWTVPKHPFRADGFDIPAYSTGNDAWTTMDTDGDLKPDLVWTSDPSTGKVWGAGGTEHWKVFKNSGAGFAASPSTFPVPKNVFRADGFDAIAGSSATETWTTMDLNGDHKPDLVWTSDPSTGKVWGAGGAQHWKVFANSGSGLSGSPLTWAVPNNPFAPDGFDNIVSATTSQYWLTMDLDGDLKPDLVWTTDPSTKKVWGSGSTPHWKIFRGGSAGFSASTSTWAVPNNAFVAEGFDTPYLTSGNNVWSTQDISGDHRPDLIWTSDPSNGKVWGVGTADHWKVFLNK